MATMKKGEKYKAHAEGEAFDGRVYEVIGPAPAHHMSPDVHLWRCRATWVDPETGRTEVELRDFSADHVGSLLKHVK